jgi:phage tail-like protein
MALLRSTSPYAQFAFLVDLGTGNTDGADAGFQECSEIASEVAITEWRNGNDKENHVRKIAGLVKTPDITLKRGVIGSLTLYQWLDQIRRGDQAALRTVVISLQNEDHSAVVMSWTLQRARLINYRVGAFTATASGVLMETAVLSADRVDVR